MAVWARRPDGLYRNCPAYGCQFHTPATGPHRVYGAPPPSRNHEQRVWEFTDCPISRITNDTWRWLQVYTALDRWGKSPIDMGVPRSRMDPRYWDAMNVLRSEYEQLQEDMRDSAQRRRRQQSTRQRRPNYPGM